ncbi:MAG: hypothetical protein E7001_06880 [Coriobacteriaceae bacterium]|nr:hypothetical protein [Coriobacteriaceae bacterium]
MAFDPIQEDCLRLILENMRRDRVFPLENPFYIARGMAAFQEDPARLIHTDRDRSFHLTARAAEAVDYRAPFMASEDEAIQQEDAARDHLAEAVALDPGNWDARRMLAELESESNDAFLAFLIEHRPEVEAAAREVVEGADDPYSRELARDLGLRPHLRWLAALASRSLISGRYSQALRVAEESLDAAPTDPAGVRHTAVLALAKLERSGDELRRFRRRHALAYRTGRPPRRHHLSDRQLDPWTLIAQMSIAWRSFDVAAANRSLSSLLKMGPHAAEALYHQAEFPEGIFSRVHVEPGSEDELILALSEATPLFQEGLGAPESAAFSAWVAENDQVRSALSADAATAREMQGAARPEGGN